MQNRTDSVTLNSLYIYNSIVYTIHTLGKRGLKLRKSRDEKMFRGKNIEIKKGKYYNLYITNTALKNLTFF